MAPFKGEPQGESLEVTVARMDERLKNVEKTVGRFNQALWLIAVGVASLVGSQLWGLIVKGAGAASGGQ